MLDLDTLARLREKIAENTLVEVSLEELAESRDYERVVLGFREKSVPIIRMICEKYRPRTLDELRDYWGIEMFVLDDEEWLQFASLFYVIGYNPLQEE